MLLGERELLMEDCRMHSRKRSERMFGWRPDSLSSLVWNGAYYKTTSATNYHRAGTIEKFAREKMRDICLWYLGEHPAEAVPKRRA